MNSLPKTVTRQRRGCDLNPGPSAPESSTLTTRLPSHPIFTSKIKNPYLQCTKTTVVWNVYETPENRKCSRMLTIFERRPILRLFET